MWREVVNEAFVWVTGYQLARPDKAKLDSQARKRKPENEPEPKLTVAEGWEDYAVAFRGRGRPVGDAWNNPRRIGIDVESPDEVIPYLDREVFTPFLGRSEVLLEIGPGAGRLTEVLLPKCNKLIAVDTSPTMIGLLRERFADETKIEYHLSDGRGLRKIPDASVDTAFSYGVFVHLQHWDIYQYLRALQRVLKPGGKALIQHSNTFSELGWNAFLREIPRQLNTHKLHHSFIVNNPQLMTEFVTRAGLEVEDILTEVVRRDAITLIRKPA